MSSSSGMNLNSMQLAWRQWMSGSGYGSAGAPGNQGQARMTRAHYESRAWALEAYAKSRAAMANNPLFRGDAMGGLESASGQIQALMAQIMAVMQSGGSASSLSDVLSRLDSASALVDKAMAELGKTSDGQGAANLKEAALQKAATTGSLSPDDAMEALGAKEPLQKLEGFYMALNKSVHEIVGTRLFLAHVAISMDVPDMAVFMMQKAYGDIRWLLDGLMSALGNRQPTPKLQTVIDDLKALKGKVLSTVVLALSTHGGPMLNPKEAEALLIPESDFDNDKNPVAKQILKHFNLIQSREELKQCTQSAMKKIIGKLPEVLTNVSNTLQGLRNDPGAGEGSAFTQIMPALGALNLAKALLQISTSGMKNSFKAEAAASANLNQYSGIIKQLEQLAQTIFKELETRSFVRSRNMNKPSISRPELEAQKPNPADRQTRENRNAKPQPLENPAELLRFTDPLAQAGLGLYALFGAGMPGGSGISSGQTDKVAELGLSGAPEVNGVQAGMASQQGRFGLMG